MRLLNTCIGLCFVTVNEATLDKMVVVYTQTDPLALVFFFFTHDIIMVTVMFLYKRQRVLIFDIFSDVYFHVSIQVALNKMIMK